MPVTKNEEDMLRAVGTQHIQLCIIDMQSSLEFRTYGTGEYFSITISLPTCDSYGPGSKFDKFN